MELQTPRLILRPWQSQDLEAFAGLNAHPEVMRHFPSCLTREQSDELAQRIQQFIERQGWGFWAVEERATGSFIGFTGLHHQPELFPFSPCTEIGWRLRRESWGCGYATEAALACLEFAFSNLSLAEVVAFTAQSNAKSASVMQRLGMTFRGLFDHPELEAGSPLSKHLLYAISQSDFNA